jgi:peptidyl-prolyl cis-trans isomerase SurA
MQYQTQRNRTPGASARTHPRFWLKAMGLACVLCQTASQVPASAQQFPGLVLSQPPQALPSAAPPPLLPSPKAEAPKAAPKPKAKVASVAKDAAPDSDGETVSKGGGDRILILVNDEPVTSREVDQRARFLSASGGAAVGTQAQEIFKRLATSEATSQKFRAIVDEILKQNQGKSREQIMAIVEKRKVEFAQGLQRQALDQARSATLPKHRKDALEEVIEEKLKVQEARKLGVSVNDDESNRIIAAIAQRNNQTEAQFAQQLKSTGVDISTMRARFRANFAWRDVVRKKFQAQIQISDKDVERLIANAPGAKGQADTQEIQIQRIVFTLPGKLDQNAMARTLADADGLRRKFGGCKTMDALAKDQAGAKFEAANFVKPSTIAEPQRSMMLSAKDGDLLPPQTSAAGVELMAVCGRRALQIDEKVREEATQELQSRKFEELAKRYLRDLRQDAHIENRG